MDIGRRDFLSGAALSRAGREAAACRQRPLGPLPPWMHDLLQQGACRACPQACVTACGQDIIRIHPDGHALAGFPWLDFSAAGCTFCGACVQACPLEHARDVPPFPGTVRLMQSRCLAWNDVICLSCIGACLSRALVPDRRQRVSVVSGRCTGCGMCVSRCPVGALAVNQEQGTSAKSGLDERNGLPL